MNSSSNSSSVATAMSPGVSARLILAIGALAAVENLFILIVFCSRRRLRRSSSLLIGLTIGHAGNGIMHMTAFWPNQASFTDYIHPLECIESIWPNLFITFYQLVPIFLALIGVERLLAVAMPHWYRRTCTKYHLWCLTLGVFVLALLSMAANWFYIWLHHPAPLIRSICYVPVLFGRTYMFVGVHVPAVAAGLLAAVCTCLGVMIGRARTTKKLSFGSKSQQSRSERARVDKQLRLTKCILMVSCLDLVFVVIPNSALLLYNAGLIPYSVDYAIYAVLLFCFDSVLNIIPFAIFNREFTAAMWNLIPCISKVPSDPSLFGIYSTRRLTRREGEDEQINTSSL